MSKRVSGFTIIELLIAVVVIAVLAAFAMVAYSGAQERARNSKTISAVNAYVKALSLYKTDNGGYPLVDSCLGVGYENGACEIDSGFETRFEDSDGLNTDYLAPYFNSSVPSPNTTFIDVSPTLRVAGAIYTGNIPQFGGVHRAGISIYHLGNGECPSISGLMLTSSNDFSSSRAKMCAYVTY